MAFRLAMPETNHFIALKAERAAQSPVSHEDEDSEQRVAPKSTSVSAFAREAGRTIKQNWVLLPPDLHGRLDDWV
jgi:hypothetical protein